MPFRTTGNRPSRWLMVAVMGVAVWMTVAMPAAQRSPPEEHVSSVVDALARGERVFGVSTYDLSLENARSLARSDIDYVYVDMEHGPMDFASLQTFLLGLNDKATFVESGSLQQPVTPLARLAPYGRESSQWAVKQALDIGLMGLIFPSIETPGQALNAVRSMRYPQRRGSPYLEPRGLRGSGTGGGRVVLGALDRRLYPAGRHMAAQPRRESRGDHDDRDRGRSPTSRRHRRRSGRGGVLHRSKRSLQFPRIATRRPGGRTGDPDESSTRAGPTTLRAALRPVPVTWRDGSGRASRYWGAAVPVAACRRQSTRRCAPAGPPRTDPWLALGSRSRMTRRSRSGVCGDRAIPLQPRRRWAALVIGGGTWRAWHARPRPDLPAHRDVLASTRRHLADDGGRGPLPSGDHRSSGAPDRKSRRVWRRIRVRHHHRSAGHHADGRLDRPRPGWSQLSRPAPLQLPPQRHADAHPVDRGPASSLWLDRGVTGRLATRRRPAGASRAGDHAAVADRDRLSAVSAGAPHPPQPDSSRRLRHGAASGQHDGGGGGNRTATGVPGSACRGDRPGGRRRRRGAGEPPDDPAHRGGATSRRRRSRPTGRR